jgi:hypothetical protein
MLHHLGSAASHRMPCCANTKSAAAVNRCCVKLIASVSCEQCCVASWQVCCQKCAVQMHHRSIYSLVRACCNAAAVCSRTAHSARVACIACLLQ